MVATVNKPRVLVVEDDADDAMILRLALERAGMAAEVMEAHNGEKAIQYLQEKISSGGPLPELVLLDLKMPKVNGFDVLAWLKTHREFNSLPAIVLSSSDFHADLKKARDLGAKEFLTKPHQLEDLVRLVGGVHERWLTGEQPDSAIVASLAEGTARTEVESQMLPMSLSAT